jgi:hypothetical protein
MTLSGYSCYVVRSAPVSLSLYVASADAAYAMSGYQFGFPPPSSFEE